MTPEPEIALVLSAELWVDALHRHCVDHGGARVRSLVLDPAVALEEEFDVLVAGERWPALTRPFVDALHQRGRRVLVVGDPERGADLAHRLGVDRIAGVAASPSELVAAVVALAPADPRDRRTSGAPVAVVRPDEHGAARPAAGGPEPIAIGGPWGAGSTELALAVAGCYARSGARAVVVDADPVTPSIAVRLGLPLEPNLCSAIDAVAFGLGAVPGALFDLGDGWPVVLVGVPNRRAGAALAGSDVAAVVRALAQRFAPVIVDVSAGTGSGIASGPDPVGAAVLAHTPVVVGVGAATPVGVIRLTEWLDEVRESAPGSSVHLVVNRAPAGRARRAEIAGELQRDARVTGLTFVPADPRVEDAAWSASLVERGPFARAAETVRRAVEAQRASSEAGRRALGGDDVA